MRKIFISIFTIFFCLGLFWGGVSFAKLNAPVLLSIPDENIGEGSVKLKWEWTPGGGEIKQFKIFYGTKPEPPKECKDITDWTARYPGSEVREYLLMGLDENTTYCWKIKAEARDIGDDSNFVDGPVFTTKSGGISDDDDDDDEEEEEELIGLVNPLKANTLEEAINALINFLFFLAMVIAPILIIYAAFLLLTASGDVAKVNKAKTIILWTLVAVAIILLAKGLPSAVKGIFGG